MLDSLEAAADRGDDVVVRHLGNLVGATDRFTAENAARFAGGALIHVPEGVTLQLPLHLSFAIPEEGARTTFRVLVVAEAHSKVTIVEEHADGAAGYLNGVVEIVVGDGAEVDYVRTQDLHKDTVHFTTGAGRDRPRRGAALDGDRPRGTHRQGAHGVAAVGSRLERARHGAVRAR